jgi:hypothetical protein
VRDGDCASTVRTSCPVTGCNGDRQSAVMKCEDAAVGRSSMEAESLELGQLAQTHCASDNHDSRSDLLCIRGISLTLLLILTCTLLHTSVSMAPFCRILSSRTPQIVCQS